MRTLDRQFTVGNSRLERVRRDVRVLFGMASMLWHYLRVGGHIRRAYRSVESSGRTLYVDELPP